MEDCIPAYGMYGNGDYKDSNAYNFPTYSDSSSYGNRINSTANLSFLIKHTSQHLDGKPWQMLFDKIRFCWVLWELTGFPTKYHTVFQKLQFMSISRGQQLVTKHKISTER